MGFDKDDTSPVVNPARRTTKVNISIVVAVLLFFVVAGLVVWALATNPATSRDTVPLP